MCHFPVSGPLPEPKKNELEKQIQALEQNKPVTKHLCGITQFTWNAATETDLAYAFHLNDIFESWCHMRHYLA